MNLDGFRGLIRPIITLLLVGGWVFAFLYALIRGVTIPDVLLNPYLDLTSTVVVFWFVSRQNTGGNSG